MHQPPNQAEWFKTDQSQLMKPTDGLSANKPDRLVFTDQSDNTLLIIDFHLNLIMTSAKIKETSVTFNDKIPSQDYSHPGDGTK